MSTCGTSASISSTSIRTKSNPTMTNTTEYAPKNDRMEKVDAIANRAQVVMAFNLLNIPILPLVKCSIILLLLRAGSVIEWLKKVLYGILIFIVGSSMIPWFLYIFICPPQTGNTWKPRTFGGLHCMGRHRMGEMLIWVTCANLLTDLLILPIPFLIVRRMMSARLRSRLVVLAVFTTSLA
jgi:hypothetical protein